MRRLDGITDAKNMNLGKVRETMRDGDAWRAAIRGVEESDTTWRLNNDTQRGRRIRGTSARAAGSSTADVCLVGRPLRFPVWHDLCPGRKNEGSVQAVPTGRELRSVLIRHFPKTLLCKLHFFLKAWAI